jgi:Caspase domain
MAKPLAAFVVAAFVLAGTLASAHAEKRVALVIGNSTYQHTAQLKNPSNDASDMAAKLRQLGFEVIDGANLSKAEMESRIRAFSAKLNGADVGLFSMRAMGFRSTARTSSHPSMRASNRTPISISRRCSSISY